MTPVNLDFLPRRIKVRPNEEMSRFKRIQDFVTEFLKEQPADYLTSIGRKMNQNIGFEKKTLEPLDNLIF
jgi:hypothetical protein